MDNTRENLIDLLRNCPYRPRPDMMWELIADHLIAHGVTFATDIKVGHWITKNGNTFCSECMVCGSPQWKVCPVCEARMDGVAKDINVPTKADRIRAMSDEELAKFLCDISTAECCDRSCPARGICGFGDNGMIKWLKQPAEEGADNG